MWQTDRQTHKCALVAYTVFKRQRIHKEMNTQTKRAVQIKETWNTIPKTMWRIGRNTDSLSITLFFAYHFACHRLRCELTVYTVICMPLECHAHTRTQTNTLFIMIAINCGILHLFIQIYQNFNSVRVSSLLILFYFNHPQKSRCHFTEHKQNTHVYMYTHTHTRSRFRFQYKWHVKYANESCMCMTFHAVIFITVYFTAKTVSRFWSIGTCFMICYRKRFSSNRKVKV